MTVPTPTTEGQTYEIPPLKVTQESLGVRYNETRVVFGECLPDGTVKGGGQLEVDVQELAYSWIRTVLRSFI